MRNRSVLRTPLPPLVVSGQSGRLFGHRPLAVVTTTCKIGSHLMIIYLCFLPLLRGTEHRQSKFNKGHLCDLLSSNGKTGWRYKFCAICSRMWISNGPPSKVPFFFGVGEVVGHVPKRRYKELKNCKLPCIRIRTALPNRGEITFAINAFNRHKTP